MRFGPVVTSRHSTDFESYKRWLPNSKKKREKNKNQEEYDTLCPLTQIWEEKQSTNRTMSAISSCRTSFGAWSGKRETRESNKTVVEAVKKKSLCTLMAVKKIKEKCRWNREHSTTEGRSSVKRTIFRKCDYKYLVRTRIHLGLFHHSNHSHGLHFLPVGLGRVCFFQNDPNKSMVSGKTTRREYWGL